MKAGMCRRGTGGGCGQPSCIAPQWPVTARRVTPRPVTGASGEMPGPASARLAESRRPTPHTSILIRSGGRNLTAPPTAKILAFSVAPL